MNPILSMIERWIGPKWSALIAFAAMYGVSIPDLQSIASQFSTYTSDNPDLLLKGGVAAFLAYLFRSARPIDPVPTPNPDIPTQFIPRDNHKSVDLSPPKVPIGIRQNNPLNIEATAEGRNRWNGEMVSSNRYALFQSPEHGIRAAAYLLRKSYFTKRNLFTVRKIIERWAPYGDNHAESVENYITHVSRALGVSAQQALRIKEDDHQLMRMIMAMCEFENAMRQPYSEGTILAAIGSI